MNHWDKVKDLRRELLEWNLIKRYREEEEKKEQTPSAPSDKENGSKAKGDSGKKTESKKKE